MDEKHDVTKPQTVIEQHLTAQATETKLIVQKVPTNDWVWLLRESVLVQGVMTLCAVGTACYMTVIGRQVPDWLLVVVSSLMAYYFGSKTARRGEPPSA